MRLRTLVSELESNRNQVKILVEEFGGNLTLPSIFITSINF